MRIIEDGNINIVIMAVVFLVCTAILGQYVESSNLASACLAVIFIMGLFLLGTEDCRRDADKIREREEEINRVDRKIMSEWKNK
jgi:positive regulator of sigma E activity